MEDCMNKIVSENDAKVMSKGQVTIPKNIREALGVDTGDRITFITDEDGVRIVNSAVYALLKIQKQMKGEAKKKSLFTEEDIVEWISKSRKKKSK
jgi:AbrB family looped-hinge helix DNA binding protein